MKIHLSFIALIVVATLFSARTTSAATVLFEDFEDSTVGYSLLPATGEVSDGFGDFYGRVGTTGLTVGTFYELNNVQDGNFFAAMDTDGDVPTTVVQLDWVGLDITNLSDIQFSGFFAEDDDGPTNQDWDDDSSVIFSFQIDGGGYQNLIAIEAVGGTNSAPAFDLDFDGFGDGAEITDTFTQYFASIGGTGTALDLRITLSNLTAGDEDFAFDNIMVTGTAVPEPSSIAILGLIAGTAGIRMRRKFAKKA